MKHSSRSSSPRVRLISFLLCYSLITTTVFLPLSPAASAGAQGSNHAAGSSSSLVQPAGILGAPGRFWASLITLLQGGGGLPSVPGPNLPDLDAARQTQVNEPEALPPIASAQACEDCAAPCPDCQINQKPIARPGGPYFGSVGQSIQFDGLASFDPDPDDAITDFIWTFGDSTPAVEVHGGTPTHTYTSQGVYTVTLKVRDSFNLLSYPVSTQANVNAAPTPTPTPGASPTPTPDQTNAATFVSQSVPSTMTAGERYNVSVTMRNTGSSTWSSAHLYRLGSQSPQDNSLWGRARAYLSTAAVAPGAQGTFSFSVLAPYSGADEPPPATFQWRMVQDGTGYFGEVTQSVNVAITSNYQAGSPGTPEVGPFSNLFMSRIAVQHRTGQPGEDLLSGNYNWGTSLLNLAGRSGLNLNLGLSYNSLAAWTRVDPPYQPLLSAKEQEPTSWTFDADRGFPSVGFRLGFPTIQGPFTNVQAGAKAFLLLLTSGARVELRRVGLTNVYEAADSSYFQLVDGDVSGLLLRTTDGSQLTYLSIAREYRCTGIKDRNGNYITIKYDPLNGTANPGRMTSVIDTLGRTINFTYDPNYRLQEIQQVRSGQSPQVWASFGYSDIEVQPNFMAAVVENGGEDPGFYEVGEAGPALGLPQSTVSVLTQVGLADGSLYKFEYNSWGQVKKVTHYAADSVEDSHPLSSVSYNLPQNSDHPRSDCPRFTQRQDWAENFNNNSPVTTTFEFDPNGDWGKVTGPDGTAHKEFFTTDFTSWQRGLVTRTETYSADSGTPKKITTTDWTQDNIGVPYPLNPRATATTVSDSDGNRRRTTIEYDLFSLPSDVYEWGPSGGSDWNLLRRTHTDYELSAAYVNQRLIGLTKQQFLFGPEDNGQRLYSKASYEYDGDLLTNQGNPLQHDVNYGIAATVRGNVTKALRWDVNHENNIDDATASTVGYNTTGSAIFSRDALAHQTSISYSDAFSSNGTDTTIPLGLTLAFPTTVTDPDGFSSSAKYNYDLGVVTRTEGPPPAGHPHGAIQTTEYDSAGRVKRITNAVNGAYTRFVYPGSQTIINKFTTIQEGQGEAYSATIFDGAGRVRAVAGDFPNSTGHYSGQFTLYDTMGQAIQQTNPTEMNHAWAAGGPDDSVGWYSRTQTYDWKGRPLLTTNTDGTTKAASYAGCGCAGGAVVTLTDEGTIVNGVPKKRQQRIYSDSLGRTVRTEVLNWDGAEQFGIGGSVYSSTVNTYNARDQLSLVREFQGAAPSDPNDLSCPSGTCQQTTMEFDGYGRLRTQHTPEQHADLATSGSTDHTTYDYKPDDTLQTVTDARGATCSYTYNARRLVTGVTHALTGTPDVNTTYIYDPAGNRTLMTDGLGGTIYGYDQLSRMISETRNFTDLAGTSTSGNYHISYEYNLAGKLKAITDPTGAQITYARDVTGRISEVNGSSFAGVNQYAHDVAYRAWGKLKHFSFGSISETSSLNTVALSYTARLQMSNYDITTTRVGTVHNGANYEYFDDGRLKYSTELTNLNEDHAYKYDQAMRITQTLTGAEARGESNPNLDGVPFRQNYAYNVWGNLTQRSGHLWGNNIPTSSSNYSNDRNAAWAYDASGSVTHDDNRQYTYDATGQVVATTEPPPRPNKPALTVTQNYDGDGQRAKLVDNGAVTFEVRSSVLGGQLVAEVNAQGEEVTGYVYADGNLLATQSHGTHPAVTWMLAAPDGSGKWEVAGGYVPQRTLELDPMGDGVPLDNPYYPGGGGDDLGNYPAYGDALNFGGSGCTLDRSPINCTVIGKVLSRNPNEVLYNIIVKRVGARSPDHRTSSSNSGGSTWANAYGSQDTDENQTWHAGLDIIPEPDKLDVSTVGYNTMWLNLRPTIHSITVLPQKTEVLTVDRAGIRNALERMLRTGDCGKFVEELINQLARDTKTPFISDYALGLFDSVAGGKGGFVRGGLANKYKVGATVSGDIKSGNAAIHLTSHFVFGSSDPRVQANAVNFLDAFQTLHELVHLAGVKGGYDDRQVAETLFRMTGTPGLPDRKDYKKEWDFIGANSTYFTQVLLQKCPVLSR